MFVSQVQVHRPQATAHLAQAMSYLQLSAEELETALNRELESNPALELVDELRCPECHRRLASLPCPVCAAPRGDGAPIVYLSPRPAGAALSDDSEETDVFARAQAPERLEDHVLKQIGPLLTAEERSIAVYLLARLDDNGLLTEMPAETAVYLHVPLEAVERVLRLIQYSDPPGIGAATPQEALLIQLDWLSSGTAPDDERQTLFELARRLIGEYLEELGKQEYALLGRRLGVSAKKVTAAAEFIRHNLTPYPAHVFWGDRRCSAAAAGEVLYRPDAAISILAHAPGRPLLVEVFTPCSGWLRVDPEFKAAVAQTPPNEQERWEAAVERAAMIVKCVQQRNHTMQRLMEIIACEQRSFILGGDADLRPLTRAQVAQMLNLHESTVSRAVAGKNVLLPDGRIIPLARFFDRSLSTRDRVRSLVLSEMRPLTDDEIAAALARQGVHVARRTVAKYRKMLGILPANIRRRDIGKAGQAARRGS